MESVRPKVVDDVTEKLFSPYITNSLWIKLNNKQTDIPKLYWTELTLNKALPQIIKNVFGDDRFVVEIEVLQNHNVELSIQCKQESELPYTVEFSDILKRLTMFLMCALMIIQ